MDQRYSLRFESGERRGETIPITVGGFVVGRKPGSSLQLVDNSVSGRHAEFIVDDEGVLLRDLGSTNGSRVGEIRIEERRLTHGDAVTLGSVAMRFLDRQLALDAPAVESLAKTKEIPAPDGVQRVSAEVMARSKRVSRPGIVVVALLAVAGGVWWFLNRGGQASGPALRAVTPVAGDLLADEYSFEADRDTWSSAESAPQAFFRGSQGRHSGAFGLSCELAANEWALHRSRELHVDATRELSVSAQLRAQGSARVRVGLEFAHGATDGGAATDPWCAWSADVDGSEFEARELTLAVPPGYDVARVVILARGGAEGGGAAADDVSVVERGVTLAPAVTIGAHRFQLAGSTTGAGGGATQVLLSQGDRTLLSGLELTHKGANPGWDGAPLSVTADGSRARIAASTPQAIVSVRCEPGLVSGGLATIAADGGYKTHSTTFERGGVTDILLGSKSELVRMALRAPATVRGVPEGAALRLTVEPQAPLSELALQVEFKEERTQAGDLAHAARNAEKKNDLGECLKQWGALLDTYPFESQLVEEAEASRARLLERGLGELRSLRLESERARFFRLVDLFRQCRDKALAIGKRFAGSEVERQAQALAADVDKDLSGLQIELEDAERVRLSAILKALEAQKASGLAAEVKAYLDSRPGGAGR